MEADPLTDNMTLLWGKEKSHVIYLPPYYL